ncbi:uncharacterized protein K02A2.6-like [Ostrinia furnacalis]|uniref:uncharacterized protein K02A2.6-like n=1 Tax=Ostrinia furnacalis TaxID=93504 RepID=UPI00103DCDAF|nr:uncharacterized protein K02A2.6-like [Ostrinia furnacalis]XP_028174822.1 uncharacterized protein K02A2.6-like [Ostrinia furnacalis]
MLSRNNLSVTEHDKEMLQIVHSVSIHLPMSPERKLLFRKETNNDETLSLLCKYYHEGWPEENKVPADCQPYYKLRNSIYFQSGFAFLEDKIIVPKNLRSDVVKLIHEGHIGIGKCLNRSRKLFYWPKMSQEIYQYVMQCHTCEKFRSRNCHEPLLPHKIPKLRFSKIGADILEFAKKPYLVVVDYFSHWLELIPLPDKSAKSVISGFIEIFSRFGFPVEIVSDNNPFNSKECLDYFKSKDICLTTSSPHYPRSNGMAEKAVDISKNILKKAAEDSVDYREYVMSYNNAPLAGMVVSPSQILNSRTMRTLVPITEKALEPVVIKNIHKLLILKQSINKSKFDRSVRKKEVKFNIGDEVVYRTGKDEYWKKGKIVKKCKEPRSYWVERDGSFPIRRTTNHLKKSFSNTKQFKTSYYNDDSRATEDNTTLNSDPMISSPARVSPPRDVVYDNNYCTRSGRVVKPPNRLDL